MRHQRIVAILSLALILLCQLGSPAQAQRPLRIAFIDSNPIDSIFWNQTADAMQAAANDLGIQFCHYRTSPWPSEMLSQVKRLLASPQRPNFLIAHISKNTGTTILKVAEQAKVPIFIINSGLERADLPSSIQPRKQYKYWIGEMLPDDRKAGSDLANILIAQARKTKKQPGNLIALDGFLVDYAGNQRDLGLKAALRQRHDAILLQSVSANWRFSQAFRKTALLLRRYPNTSIVWAADDRMALGSIQALRSRYKQAGKDVLIGGINGEPGALKAISRGEMFVTLGGHFLEGAWAMVLLHDYSHGIDFGRDQVRWQTRLIPITKGNLNRYRNQTAPSKIDFKRFSKVYNPRLMDYDFNIQSLVGRS